MYCHANTGKLQITVMRDTKENLHQLATSKEGNLFLVSPHFRASFQNGEGGNLDCCNLVRIREEQAVEATWLQLKHPQLLLSVLLSEHGNILISQAAHHAGDRQVPL